MKHFIQHADYPHFQELLRARAVVLRGEIRDTLLKSKQEQFSKLAGQVRDLGDEAMADLLVDINHAEIARDVREVRDIEAAQRRIDTGKYGTCVDCNDQIPRVRLEAYPSAKRCLSCQQQHEKRLGIPRPPSL